MALIECPSCGRELSERATKCPQCGMSMVDIQSALHQSKPTAISKDKDNNENLQLKEEHAALQKQVAALKEEAKRLQESIASEKKELDALNHTKQQMESEIAKNKASERKVRNLQVEIDQLQKQASALKEEVEQQKSLIASGQAALDRIKVQTEAAKKEAKEANRLPKWQRVVTWILCIAIAATIAWIIWMVITFNK